MLVTLRISLPIPLPLVQIKVEGTQRFILGPVNPLINVTRDYIFDKLPVRTHSALKR